MWILSRYVVCEVLKVFAIALLTLTLMTTLGMGVKDGLNRGFPPSVIAATMPYILPEMLGITIPVAILLAVTSVFGRMAGTNEIVALKSLGVSPMAVVWPVLLAAFVLSLVTVSMYELAATWGRPSAERIGSESIEQIAYSVLRTERSFSSPPKFSIAVARVEGRKLIEPVITLQPEADHPPITITAAEAELRTEKDAGGLDLRCRDCEIEVEGGIRGSLRTWEQIIPFDPPKRRIHRDWLAQGEIADQVAKWKRDLADIEKRRAALAGPVPTSIPREINYLHRQLCRLQAEPYRRWANGFSCLCFVLVGAPVAIARRSDNFLSSFFVCFLPILVVYYPLMMVQEDLATSGALPPAAFWLGDIILLIPAAWFLRRVIRY